MCQLNSVAKPNQTQTQTRAEAAPQCIAPANCAPSGYRPLSALHMSQRSTTQKRKVVRSPASQQIFDSFLADLDEVDEAGSRLSSPMAESLKADAQTRYRQARETRSRQMLELEEAKVEAAKARLQKVSRSEAGTDSDSDDFEGDAKANRKQAGSRSSKKGSTKSSCNE